ncbi:MAG TPA: UDP-N-acetylmuramoyl-tripeptide--D-alanyl-D-alanine ligase [Pyrinomonadaceae bacterium]|nr:UDP-N-acetylmuramoyl-tripeptide--D-alanyl-D-alanine ligase [Pyrinomonadaceae bacterium]
MKLETVIKYMDADASKLNPALLGREVQSFAIDSREVRAGEVFFAFSQPEYQNNCFNGNFQDSHQYIPSAFERGAAFCVARPDRFAEHRAVLEEFRDRLIFVRDAILALQNLAHGVYLEWNKPVVAITGSAGKTTAKELTAHVLQSSGRKILRNIKNYNNGLGHPLTVLKLAADKSFDAAVLEMGMSTPSNEIARLCGITPPDFAVELNVLPVHVEHLGSIENVAKAKAELVEGMKPEGTAILNADDFRVLAMRQLHKGKTITFGIEQKADVSASEIEMERFGETNFALNLPNEKADVRLQLSGRHNVLNALAASAVGFGFGMSAREIAEALETIAPPAQRGEVLHFAEGFTIINDSYNSNPAALLEMVKTLVDNGKTAKRKIVVAGEMLELGETEKEIHRETGKQFASSGIDFLIGVRGLAKELTESAKENGLSKTKFFADSTEAGEFLANEISAGDLVLVKGSRGVRTERVIEKLLEDFNLEK